MKKRAVCTVLSIVMCLAVISGAMSVFAAPESEYFLQDSALRQALGAYMEGTSFQDPDSEDWKKDNEENIITALQGISGKVDLSDKQITSLEGLCSEESTYLTKVTAIQLNGNAISEIPQGTFRGNTLLEYVEADQVTAVKSHAFAGCSALKEAVLPEVSTLEANTFDGCKKLELALFGKITSCQGNSLGDNVNGDVHVYVREGSAAVTSAQRTLSTPTVTFDPAQLDAGKVKLVQSNTTALTYTVSGGCGEYRYEAYLTDTSESVAKITSQSANTVTLQATGQGQTQLCLRVSLQMADGTYFALFTLQGCGIEVSALQRPLTSLTIDRTDLPLMTSDAPVTLEVNAQPQDADEGYTWQSSDENVATVDLNGTVTPVGDGDTTITCSTNYSNLTASCQVHVTQAVFPEVTKTTLAATGGSFKEQDCYVTITDSVSQKTKLNVNYQAGVNMKNTAWTSSNTAVVEVDENGVLTPKATGYATVSVSFNSGYTGHSFTMVRFVTVVKPYTTFAFTKSAMTITTEGGTRNLPFEGAPNNADEGVTWVSSDTGVVTVDTAGAVTPVAPGSATIMAKTAFSDKVISCTVTVETSVYPKADQSSVGTQGGGAKTVKGELTMAVNSNKETQLYIDFADNSANMKDITWHSSDDTILEVDSNGYVTTKNAGKATVTATVNENYGAQTYTLTHEVTVVKPYSALTLSKTAINLTLIDKAYEGLRIENSSNANESLTWSSSDSSVAAVDQYGNITPKATGTATITVTADFSSALQQQCTVTVINPSVRFASEKRALDPTQKDNSCKLVYSIENGNSSTASVQWEWTFENNDTLYHDSIKIASDGTVTVDKPMVKLVGAIVNVRAKLDNQCDNGGEAESARAAECQLYLTEPIKQAAFAEQNVSIFVGNTHRLQPNCTPTSSWLNGLKNFKSDNTAVATVDSDGVVTAKKVGSCKITAVSEDGEDKYTYCTVTVTMPVSKIDLNKTSVTVNAKSTYQLSATVTPTAATDKALSWTSSNKAVATVNGSGKVTAVKQGTAYITATAKDGSGVSARCKVSVKSVTTNIRVPQTAVYVVKKKYVTIPYVVDTNDGTKLTPTFSSSNSKVATVNSSGKITGKKAGTAKITIKSGNKKRVVTVYVKNYGTSLKSVKITSIPKGSKLKVGKTDDLKVSFSPKAATGAVVKWSSTNTSVLTIDKAGKMVAKRKGSTRVTAKVGSKKKTIIINVT